MDERRRRDEAIFDRHGFPGCTKVRQQFCPLQAGLGVPGQTLETPDPRVEPTFQRSPLASPGKEQNPESESAENHGINGDVLLMCTKPRYDARIGCGFCRLAQNVGVNQVLPGASPPTANPSHDESDSQRIGRLRLDRHEEVLSRTSEQPLDDAIVLWRGSPDQAVVATIETFDVELLAWFDAVHLPEVGRKNDLAL